MKRLFITTVSLLLCTAASFAQTYKIYQTQNVHTALKLNTCTGEVTQVQDDGQSWTFVEELEPYNYIELRAA